MQPDDETATWVRQWEDAVRVAGVYADLFPGQRFRVTREDDPYGHGARWAVREAVQVAEPCS